MLRVLGILFSALWAARINLGFSAFQRFSIWALGVSVSGFGYAKHFSGLSIIDSGLA